MFRFGQFPAYTVDIHNALCWVIVTQYLGVELADRLCFLFRNLISRQQNAYLV